ncbi:MAG TPA: nucleotidyltransferase [Candidatus Angelobacter sp.]|nr:nucleotidyltransferase [Candidatus Angelobacter sp.]
MSWEGTFKFWAKPPGETELTKCDNAVSAVRKAIDASADLADKTIRVFAQGSYCNRTNVRQNSDVDICIMCSDSFFFDLPQGEESSNFGLTVPAPYSFAEYKNDVQSALVGRFLAKGVSRGNKAFDIHENTYRIDADAVAAFEYRRYYSDGSYLEGTAFIPDKGALVINWPQQNYDNGVSKNKETGGRFKDMVRILKRLQIRMNDEGIEAAKNIPSFLIECLVWNVPATAFGHADYRDDVRSSLAFLFNNTIEFDDCSEWGEINELKYLFRSVQPWTLERTHSFISAAWDYLGLE